MYRFTKGKLYYKPESGEEVTPPRHKGPKLPLSTTWDFRFISPVGLLESVEKLNFKNTPACKRRERVLKNGVSNTHPENPGDTVQLRDRPAQTWASKFQ